MATWMSHFRVADYFINKLDVLEKEFIVGNIAPDCGEPDEMRREFKPPSKVTHWTPSGYKKDIDSQAFYKKYLENYRSLSKKKYSFYLGYYVHLLTDIVFTREIAVPKENKYSKEFEENPDFIWTMKEDWYDIDHLYLQRNPDFYTFKVFSTVEEFPNEYLDYYSQTAMIKQIKYIIDFYKSYDGQGLDRVYQYLTPEEMDDFVDKACENIEKVLMDKGMLRK